VHPVTLETLTAPLPPDFVGLMERLRAPSDRPGGP
jgi:hypothetical protein